MVSKWGGRTWLRERIAAAEKAFRSTGGVDRRSFDFTKKPAGMTERTAFLLVAAQEAGMAAESLLAGVRGHERDAAWYLLGMFDGVFEGRDARSVAERAARRMGADVRNAGAAPRHAQWCQAASRIWKRRPKLTITAVAKLVREQHDLPVSEHTIRREIAKLRPPRR